MLLLLSALLIACFTVGVASPRSQVVEPSRSVVKFPYSSPPHYHRWPTSSLSIRQREGLSNSTRGGSPGGIVFPTDDPLTDRSKPSRPLESCKDGGKFCENVPDYPQALLENMLEDYAVEYRALFGNDLLDDESVKHRIGSPLENPLCESRVNIIFPQKAEDKDGRLKYVVNTDDHKQGVRIETCVSEGSACQFSESFPSTYKVTCRQRHVYRKLVALDNNKLEPNLFPMPSCCMCMVETIPINYEMETSALETRANKPKDQIPRQDKPKDGVVSRIGTPTNTTVKSFAYGEDRT